MLTGAYIVPHPPIIIPEIGKGQEQIIRNTINAYQMIARDIALRKPETIVVFSPHAPAYRDYIHISSGSHAYGDFSKFHAEDVQFRAVYDEEFVQLLEQECRIEGIAAGTAGDQSPVLDHGTMVPLHAILQEYSNFKLVRISVSGLERERQVAFGDCVRRVIDASGKNTVVIASADLSHKLKEDGPYGFDEQGVLFDQEIVDIIKSGDYERLLDIDEYCEEASANCGYPSLLMLYGVIQAYPMDSQFLSYESPFGVGYATAMLHVMKKDPYVALAKETLEHFVIHRQLLTLDSVLHNDLFKRQGAVFVSLKKFGELRGCIGTLVPTRESIAEEIMVNAISAGTRDPRFPPVQSHELPYLEYSVDILKEAERITSLEELDVKRYGVIVHDAYRRGLLLPDLDGVDTPEQQVKIALHKAGMDPEEPFILERFEVVRHHEYHL